jgi:serine protease Do
MRFAVLRRRFCVVTFVSIALTAAAGAQEVPDVLRTKVDVAVAKVKPALVRIHVVWSTFGEGREIKYQATGSGAIIREDGYVVTNHHVAGHATRLFCTLSTKEEIEAELVGTDALTDIAVIKLKSDGRRRFPVAKWGDSSKVEVGDHVLAMGSPMSLSQSVTLGIVSNNEMVMPSMFGRSGQLTLDGEDVGSLVRWIGHDAQIYGGNSGGPLCNLQGEIIGINEISIGLGGAIPGNLAQHVVQQIIDHGKITRAWIGFSVQPQLKSAAGQNGVLISSVIEGSPADAAGFEPGDVLTSLAGESLDIRFDEQIPPFNGMVAGLAIGKPVAAEVRRGKETKTLNVTPREREKMVPKQQELKEWGITARNLSYVNAKELKRESTDGVFIATVRPGGAIADAKPDPSPRDVIVEVDGKPVKDLDGLQKITDELIKDAEDLVPVIVKYERKGDEYLTLVKVGIREPNAPGKEVQKAWLPVSTQVITRDLAEGLGDEGLKGFRVTQVYKGTTAEAAGLKVGDLIYAVDGMPLEATAPEDFEELETLIRQYQIGAKAEINLKRDGEKMTIPVELARSPRVRREMNEYEDLFFEFTARDVTFMDRVDEEIEEDTEGVLVDDVKSGGWAQLGGLYVNDLILAVNGEAVKDVDGLETIMERIADEQDDYVILKIRRGIYTAFLEMEPKWDGD